VSHASITRRVFAVFFLVLFACGISFGVAEGRQRLVSPELLSRAGLVIVWDDELPIDSAEKLQKLYIVGDELYALSERNYLISLGKDRGEKIFAKYAAPLGQPVGEPVLYEDKLLFVLGNRVVTIDERTGEELGSKNIEYRLMCPAVRNSKYFYLSGVDRRLHVLRADGMVPLFEVSVGNSIIKSVIAAENFVIFGTDAGNVVGMLAGEAARLWQFDAAGGIIERLVLDETSIFFSSKDTNVYRIDMTGPQSVELVWKYQVAGIPENAPRVGKMAVYQYVRGKGLTAIDKETGVALWSLSEGIELLSESGSRAYIITKNETLTVMDNMARGKLYSVNFRGVRRFAFNTGDSKMYISDEHGRIACLQPVK
jgi:outer membrane protein assembly factor BamB